MADVELEFEIVRDRWLAAGGKDTGGIIQWFAPPIVGRWVQSEIAAQEVADLRFIGAEHGGRWADVTGSCSPSAIRWGGGETVQAAPPTRLVRPSAACHRCVARPAVSPSVGSATTTSSTWGGWAERRCAREAGVSAGRS